MAVKRRTWQTVWLGDTLDVEAVRLNYGRAAGDAITVEVRQGAVAKVLVAGRESEFARCELVNMMPSTGTASFVWEWMARLYASIHEKGDML